MMQTMAGRCIHRSDSGIRVMDNGLYRWMMFESEAIQTLLFKAAPYTRGLRYIDALTFMAKTLPGDTCLLGLGGGGAAHALNKHMNTAKLSVVELDAEVIAVARQFFMLDRIANMTMLQAEAAAFIERCEQRFKHVLVDLYDAHQYPDGCNNRAFFMHCQRVLTEDGILSVNLANRLDHRSVFELIRDQFVGKTIVMPVTGRENLVIVAYKNQSPQRMIELLSQQNSIKKLSWDQDWGCIAELRY